MTKNLFILWRVKQCRVSFGVVSQLMNAKASDVSIVIYVLDDTPEDEAWIVQSGVSELVKICCCFA